MVFCFGELLLRMSPVVGGEWIRSSSMPVFVGGAELNAAIALSNWGIPAGYCTALPEHYLAEEIIGYISSKGIDAGPIHRSGNRIGAYYLPQGADLKNAGVIYDRAGSSFADLKRGMIDWDKTLNGYSWFHFSAISAALSAHTADLCLEALEAASRKGLKVSVDLNYRAKLWKYGVLPTDVMPALVKYCHVIMGNLWAVESLLGIKSPVTGSTGKPTNELVSAASESMRAVRNQYPQAGTLAYTFRLQDDYWAVLGTTDAKEWVSDEFEIGEVTDRVGSGDCFMAGLIYGLYKGHEPARVVNFAAAAAVGKLHERGDASSQQISDVEHILSTRSKQGNGQPG